MNQMFIDQIVRFNLISQYLPKAPATVFEVGCGGGEMMRWLEQKGYIVSGCEADSNLVSHAQSWAVPNQVILADGTKLPCEDNFFDCTTSCDVLEHVLPELRESFLDEIFRITKPGGKVVLTVWLNKTLSFKLYGALYLLATGQLPQWYIEHIQIPEPLIEPIKEYFEKRCEQVEIIPYQGTVNLAAMLAQNVAAAKGKFNLIKLINYIDFIVKKYDFFGRKTSYLFAGIKVR
ncbi:MAG: hypothetical protein C4323_00835 [Mastigocladus sp. ERB_26_2]